MRLGHWRSSWTWILAGLERRWRGEGLASGSRGEVLHPLSSGSMVLRMELKSDQCLVHSELSQRTAIISSAHTK